MTPLLTPWLRGCRSRWPIAAIVGLVAMADRSPAWTMAPSVPTYGAHEGGPPVLLSNAAGGNPYASVVRYQGRATCTGVFLATIPDDADPGDAPAYVLSNGHCSDFPGANDVLPDRPAVRGQVIFNYFIDARSSHVVVPVVRNAYATMKGQDIAVLELGASYADLREQGFEPWPPTLTLPHANEPVVIVGAPLQQNPATAFLRLAACRLDGRAALVVEYVWHWYGFDRNLCSGIAPGSSGSPVISQLTGRVLGLVNTSTAGGRAPYTECTLDHPCEPKGQAAEGRAETTYSTPLVGIARCFDSGGRFDVREPGCPLDPGDQLRATPTFLGAVNPTLTTVAVGQPRRQWNVTLSGGFDYYRYKAVTASAEDCRDLRGYGDPRRVADRPVIDDALPTTDGWRHLCVLGGRQSRWGDEWQHPDYPTIVAVYIDTVPPRVPPPITIEENEIAWRVTFDTYDPEVSAYTYKFGRPSETRCDDPADYRLVFVPFIALPKSGRPYLFCAIPYDGASNPGRTVEAMLP